MNLYSTSGDLLFFSRQPTLKRALVEAVAGGVCLHGINLRRAQLRGARLDGMMAPGACVWGADFTGCDMAEANISGADARMATFTDTCLVDTLCTDTRFEGAYFKNPLLDGVDFSECQFSCPSILRQPLHMCHSLRGAVYWHRGEQACPLDSGIMRFQTTGCELISLGGWVILNDTLFDPALKNVPFP